WKVVFFSPRGRQLHANYLKQLLTFLDKLACFHRWYIRLVQSGLSHFIERGLPKMTPMEYIQAGRIFIGFEVDDDLLPYMVNKYGTDCWVYASDIPHAHRNPDSPKHVLNRADLPEFVKEKILWHGTAKLYGFDLPASNGGK
ncbi:MAG: putative TIM-barrel fold metal-dependent hydrolase, partial [Kiritimatiellia bacterium]